MQVFPRLHWRTEFEPCHGVYEEAIRLDEEQSWKDCKS